MAIGLRTSALSVDNGASATVSVTSDGTPVAGDVCLIFHGNDFYTVATMPPPTGTNLGTITQVTGATADGGTNGAHIKTYVAVVQANGVVTASVTETGAHDEDKSIAVVVLSGADAVTPIDDSAGNAGGGTSPHPAPSVSPGTATAYLVCVDHSGGGAATTGYTPPTGMTEIYDLKQGGLSTTAAVQQLAALGPTGVKNFTPASAVPFGTVSVAVRTATADVRQSVGVANVGASASSGATKVAASRALAAAAGGAPRAGASRLARALGSAVAAIAARWTTGSPVTSRRLRVSGREPARRWFGRGAARRLSGREPEA